MNEGTRALGDETSSLGSYLQAYRSQQRLTLQELAELCQLSIATLLDVEQGAKADPDTMRALSEGLEVSLEELYRVASGGHQVSLTTIASEPGEEWSGFATTLAQAAKDLSLQQLRQVVDYIGLLKLAERGRILELRSKRLDDSSP